MFSLLKYELKYASINILKILLINVAILVYIQFTYDKTVINYLCLVLFGFYSVQTFSVLFTEKRSYYLKPIPVSNLQLASQRIFVILTIFVTIFLIGLIAHLFIGIRTIKWSNSIGELFMFGGLSLLIVFSLIIFSDIYTYFKRRNAQIIYLIILFLTSPLLLVWILVQVSKTYTSSLGYGVNFNIYLFVIDALLIAISCYTFMKRKKFTIF